jgi:hypothetical protein
VTNELVSERKRTLNTRRKEKEYKKPIEKKNLIYLSVLDLNRQLRVMLTKHRFHHQLTKSAHYS